MNMKNYDAFISRASQELAKQFLAQEDSLAQRALFLDTDIAEVTRQLGLQTAQHIYEQMVADHVEQKKMMD